MSDVVISGYYGLGNSGDEALLRSIVDDLRKISPDITITALSGDASLTNKMYGIKTINRFNPFSIIREFRSAKLLLSGGGTLIQDATSTKSLLYYLGIISLAKKMGLKVMLYANGMGPLKEKNISKVNSVLNKVDLITLREAVSLEEIKRCNIAEPEVIVTADPAFNLTLENEHCADEIFAKYSVPDNSKIVAVSVREAKNLPKNFEEKMAHILDDISRKGYLPIFIPMQISADLDISLRIASRMKEQSKVIDTQMQVEEMLAIIAKCEIVCGMRLHMLIFASVMNVPMAGIAYDPKIKGFMEYMNQTTYVELEEFSEDEFRDIAFSCLKNSKALRQELCEKSKPLREKATQNAHLAIELLNKK